MFVNNERSLKNADRRKQIGSVWKLCEENWGLKGFSGIKKLFSGIIWKRNLKNSKRKPKAFFILSVFIFDYVKLRLCSADSPYMWADFYLVCPERTFWLSAFSSGRTIQKSITGVFHFLTGHFMFLMDWAGIQPSNFQMTSYFPRREFILRTGPSNYES